MAEETSQPAQPSVNVLAQYIRDLSFENILAQKGVSGDVTPDIQIQVKLDARKRSIANQYETIIKLNIDSKSKDTNDQLFLLEIEYACWKVILTTGDLTELFWRFFFKNAAEIIRESRVRECCCCF